VSELTVDRVGDVALVTLNRPERRNALTAGLMVAIGATMSELDADTAVGAIVLTGHDPAFCAGLDLAELSTSGENLRVDATGRPWPRLRTPVVGAINGPAVTGGLELVLHCDFAIASEQAAFADTHSRVGVMPGWGLSVLLPQAIGLRRAKQMSFTAAYVRADEALAWGLVNRVVPHEQLLPEAMGLAQAICANDRAAVPTLLTLYDDNADDQTASGLRREYVLAREWRDNMVSPEAVAQRQDGIRAHGHSQIS
jgi:enoyl-CoA hydratase